MKLILVSLITVFSATSSAQIWDSIWGKKSKSQVIEPASINPNQSYPLLVVLHGCLQSGQDIASASQFGQFAKEKKFFVLYPEQSNLANSMRCWNWFRTQDQMRGGEPQLIVDEVLKLQKSHTINIDRVYIVGFSAGAAMASNIAACYPDIFSGVAIHSGTTYKAATSMGQAFTAMKQGSLIPIEEGAEKAFACSGSKKQRPIDTFIIHGELDTVVTPRYVNQLTEQFVAINDFLDDGKRNNSQNYEQTFSKNGTSRGGYRYQHRIWKSQDVKMSTLTISELKHAWSGGRQQQYSDPNGPSATQYILDFFNL